MTNTVIPTEALVPPGFGVLLGVLVGMILWSAIGCFVLALVLR